MTEAEDRVRAAFHSQGKSCALLGSPFMGRLMPLMAARLTPGTAVGARILAWEGDVGPAGQSVPLRIAGALHGLVLSDMDERLAAVYPPYGSANAPPNGPPNGPDDDTLWEAVEGAFLRHEAQVMDWLDHAPQTNEVRRCAALIPAVWWLCDTMGNAPDLILSELGASAGLNLAGVGGFGIDTPGGLAGPPGAKVRLGPEWRGRPLPPPGSGKVLATAGVDRNPIDVHDPVQALRLLSYLWPDQPERLTLTRAAFDLVREPPEHGDAAPWLSARLRRWADDTPRDGQPLLHVVYNTIAWQYFAPETQAACTHALEHAGRASSPTHALAHVALEADGRRDGAALTVRLWPQHPEPRLLARADFHGRWVDWRG